MTATQFLSETVIKTWIHKAYAHWCAASKLDVDALMPVCGCVCFFGDVRFIILSLLSWHRQNLQLFFFPFSLFLYLFLESKLSLGLLPSIRCWIGRMAEKSFDYNFGRHRQNLPLQIGDLRAFLVIFWWQVVQIRQKLVSLFLRALIVCPRPGRNSFHTDD